MFVRFASMAIGGMAVLLFVLAMLATFSPVT